MYEPRFDRDKFKELVLYIAHKSLRDAKFGKTKLNKILWWSDFLAYAHHGEAITGARYMRLPNGPAPRHLVPTLNEMIAAGDAVVVSREAVYGPAVESVIARRSANLALFTGPQIAIVDQVITELWNKTAKGVSGLSHRKSVGWTFADDRGDIPYETVFVCNPEVRKVKVRDRKWATGAAAKLAALAE